MTFIPSHCLQLLLLLFFFMVSSFLIPNLLLYVLVNASAMHFLCLSFTVSSFEIKRRAPRIVSSIEHDTLRFCWKIFDYHMIFTNQFHRNGGSVGSIYFFCAPSSSTTRASRSPNSCHRSPIKRKKITPSLQVRKGVAWHSRQQVID